MRLTKIIVFIILILSSHIASAKIHLYLAARPNYSGVGAAVVGIYDWEIGMINAQSFGAQKVFKFSGKYFTTMGFSLLGSAMGLTGSIGVNYIMFWNVGLRMELYQYFLADNTAKGAGLLGVTWNF